MVQVCDVRTETGSGWFYAFNPNIARECPLVFRACKVRHIVCDFSAVDLNEFHLVGDAESFRRCVSLVLIHSTNTLENSSVGSFDVSDDTARFVSFFQRFIGFVEIWIDC